MPGRLVGALITAMLAALAGGANAAAKPAVPQRLCTVSDPRLAELSGLVVAGPGSFWAVADGGRATVVHRLDGATCAVTGTRTASINPYDPEDLAVGPDGALWVGDIGDNERTRDTVAVIVLPDRGAPSLHRLGYPDGPHDAEALLVDGAGRPVIVTKEGGFGAGVYRTAEPPAGEGPTPLIRVGTVALPASDATSGPLGAIGSRLVTGAAATPDGAIVALRSYTDAWLYRVRDGDIAAALTGPAVRVPLPDEPQGEAIAFGPDGTLYSSGEARGGVLGEIRAVPGAAALVGDPRAPAAAPQPPEPQSPGSQPPVSQPPEPQPADPDLWWSPAAAGGGIAVALLVLLAIAMWVRGRR
ncbi:MAG: esterase-like activity of phytase family protein [Pseudonocardia sp.]|nr:esterase-like activity of phytase family protein [Pseudonocardia sp.]